MSRSNNMPPTDIDAMLHDVSNQMARSQLFRRLSAKSNNSSPGSKKGNARVVKPHSSGGTPLGVQRRRTTTAHASRTKPPTAPSFASVQQLPQAATASTHRPRQNGPPSATRPLTWHPGSYRLDKCPQEIPYNNNLSFYPTTAPQEPHFTGYSNYSSFSSFNSTLPPEAQGQDLFSSDYSQQSTSDNSLEYTNSSSFYQPPMYDYSTLFPHQDTTLSSTYLQYPSSLQMTDPSQVPSDYAIYSTQHTPNLFSSQYVCNPPQYVQSPNPPQITKQRSKELVGMGLYDGPSRKELSTPDTSADRISQLLVPPQGKGLKLEETWQPRDEDADENEEEGSSADEAEEDLPPALAQAEVQPSLFPTYGDLSNQSFFFDTDDPYTGCMSFDQGIQACPPKAPEPSLQNFMWF
ncbi:MAG: hypothetical protein Q9225_004958 [Loekoesia sp. 1 TL-2023]